MRRFVWLVCCFILCSGDVEAASKKAIYVDTGITVSGMDSVNYLSVNGKDKKLNYKLLQAQYDETVYNLFSLENPFYEGKMPDEVPMPEYLNRERIIAVLAIHEQSALQTVKQLLGVNLTKNEYIAATQVAVHMIAADYSQEYKIDIESISNKNILVTAQWLTEKADEYLSKKPSDLDILTYLWPTVKLSINSDLAKGNVKGYFNYFGPYQIECENTDVKVAPQNEPDCYAIVNAIEGEVIDTVSVNESFYIRFDKKLLSDISILFSAETIVPEQKTYQNFVFISKKKENVTVPFVISNKGNSGQIQYLKLDSLTKTAIPGTVIGIKDKGGSLVASITTNQSGVAISPLLKAGSYTVYEINPAPGYAIDTNIYEAIIRGSGEKINIASQASPDLAILNFICKDSSTNAPVNGSVFEILDDKGVIVSKIGFSDKGKCSNIKLAAGRYILKETVSNPAYELLVNKSEFEAVAGEVTEVVLTKTKASKYIKFIVDKGNLLSDVWLELYSKDGTRITEMETDSSGVLRLSLPIGHYFVRNKATSNFPAGKAVSFEVSSSNEDMEVHIGLDSYEAFVTGVITAADGSFLPGIGVVAVDDTGEEYSIAISDYKGSYRLENLPDNAVIYIKVYKAPNGVAGIYKNNKLITLNKETKKDIQLMSIDQYRNSTLFDEKIPNDGLYTLQSDFKNEPFYEIESTVNQVEEPSPDLPDTNSSDLLDTDEVSQEKKKPNEVLLVVILVFLAVGVSILVITVNQTKRNSKQNKK